MSTPAAPTSSPRFAGRLWPVGPVAGLARLWATLLVLLVAVAVSIAPARAAANLPSQPALFARAAKGLAAAPQAPESPHASSPASSAASARAPVPVQAALPAPQLPQDMRTRLVGQGTMRIHYPERFTPVIATLEREAPLALERLKAHLAIDHMPVVDVWVLGELDAWFRWHGLPSGAPPWAVGLSLSQRATVLLLHGTGPGGKAVDLVKTLVHELAHVAMDVAAGQRRAPRWLHEGFAIRHAEEWDPERSELLSRAAAIGTLAPLEQLERHFPDHHQSASVAYAQSFHFVRHLETRFGTDILARTLALVRQGHSYEAALEQVTQEPWHTIQGQWREELEGGNHYLAILRDESLVLFASSLFFLVAFVGKLIRRRRQLQQLVDEEPPGTWDYDPSRYPLPGEGLPRR